MSRTFLTVDIEHLVSQLSTDEKISLLSAPNWWNTTSIERLGIPSIRMSDGPNGVRGSSHFVSTPAQCIPCATSLAATFDLGLISQVGKFLAEETRLKSAVVLLAPTCNIQRTPLGGRAFESFSEDPYLSGTLAASYVSGLQSGNVASTIKHLVGNDQEHERTAADSVMSERALREVYLYPFMLAQRLAKPAAFMTSYGRIKGIHCSENTFLLQDVLRVEWGFNGLVMSDWFGTYSVDGSLNAGLDLEMPGPSRWRTASLVNHCLTAQKIDNATLDRRVQTVLRFVQNRARENPEIVYGDNKERSRDVPKVRDFCRTVAAEGIVLLKNNGLLPLSPQQVKLLAVIGANARECIVSGGGSAALKPSYVVTPLDGLRAGAYEGLKIEFENGCYAHKYLPTLERFMNTHEGESGWLCTFHNHKEDGGLTEAIATYILNDTRVKLNDSLPPGLTQMWSMRLCGRLSIDKSCAFELGLTVAGRAKLWVNNELVIDNWTKQTPGDFFYGQGTIEEKGVINMVKGKAVDILVEYTNSSPPPDGSVLGRSSQPALMRGVRLGGCERIDPITAIQSAVDLASRADAVIVVAGLGPEWESEGFDRPSLHLPGQQDELIKQVSLVNSRTIVCLQAGSAVSMPWLENISGLVQAWYSGNEAGNAIADVLYGKVNPCGRLPLTFPARIEDTPSHLNIRCEDGKIHYREDLFVGYKHYLAKGIRPLFAFGFGLSYSQFSLEHSEIIQLSNSDTCIDVVVSVTIRNMGMIPGSEVVQVYVAHPENGITQPPLQLRGYAKTHVSPLSSATLSIHLDKYAFAFWDTGSHAWCVLAGTYQLHIGFSSDNIVKMLNVMFPVKVTWKDL